MEVKFELEHLGKISLQNVILDLLCDLEFQESQIKVLRQEKEMLNKQNFDLIDTIGALRSEISQLKCSNWRTNGSNTPDR